MESLAKRFLETRSYTTQIFKPLSIEDYIIQPMEIVSPPKWSLGHTTWFFEVFILLKYSKDYKLFSSGFPFLFNSYYNNAGDRVVRHNRGDLTRPTVSEVYKYRNYVDDAMVNFIKKGLHKEVEDLIELGIQHEQQHQELFWTDLKYTLSLNPLNIRYEGDLPFHEATEKKENKFLKIDEGIYTVGADIKEFCYDNELSRHKTYIYNFEIASNLVTNDEFVEFIEAGGYQDFNCWHDEGWKWVNDNDVKSPLYWQKKDGKWMNYTLLGLEPVDMSQAVKHINYYEAFAFAEWKGMRLPTEFEWEVAADKFEWGRRWEWTNSAYLPYPGYHKAEGAVGEYNGKFMVNQMVLRGASVATTPGHSRKTYRNFFHPWEQWQFAGIRLAK